MQNDFKQELKFRQAIRCSDCNTEYFVGARVKSGRCPACGNIVYLSGPSRLASAVAPGGEDKEIALKEFKLHSGTPPSPASHALRQEQEATGTADQREVENILRRYPNEWELWGYVSRHFDSAEGHAAYLSFCARRLVMDRASQRYLQHQKVFAPLGVVDHWQARVAEVMLTRLTILTQVQWERSQRTLRVGDFFGPYKSRLAWSFVWLCFGLVLFIALAAIFP